MVVLHANQPPQASFFAGTHYGNLTSNFYFDATATDDDEDWENEIQVRWDFESDGTWDTEFSQSRTVYHQYEGEGEYTITLEAKDSGGLTAQASLDVHVSDGTYPTGLIIDSDSGDTYGTVKIGNQWWMAENLKNLTNRSCYRNQADNCELFGGLYNWNNLMNGSRSPKARGLCPSGWHVPTADEWQTLIDHVGGTEQARRMLEPDGETDFRMLYSGQISGTGQSEWGGTVTNFWTSNTISGDNSWAFSFQAGKDNYWKLALGRSSRNSVRCIKN